MYRNKENKKTKNNNNNNNMPRIIHQETAGVGDTILVTYNSHIGRTAIVSVVNDAKCTVKFEDGKPGKFVMHGDYRIIKKKGNSNQIRRKLNDDDDIKLVFNENNKSDETKMRVSQVEMTQDMINIAAKVAAMTNNEMEASNLVARIAEGIENMALDLIEQRENKNLK